MRYITLFRGVDDRDDIRSGLGRGIVGSLERFLGGALVDVNVAAVSLPVLVVDTCAGRSICCTEDTGSMFLRTEVIDSALRFVVIRPLALEALHLDDLWRCIHLGGKFCITGWIFC